MSSIALANSEAFSQIESEYTSISCNFSLFVWSVLCIEFLMSYVADHTMKEKHIKSSDSESSDDCLIPQSELI